MPEAAEAIEEKKLPAAPWPPRAAIGRPAFWSSAG